MPLLYYVSVSIHVLSAMLWIGGMLFLGVVGAPALRAVDPPAVRQRLFQQLGLRFRLVGWWAIGLLIATGTINLYYRGWLLWDGVLGSAAFWRTPQGHALAFKLGAVAAMLVVSSIHDFVLGPQAGAAVPGSPGALVLRRRAALLARTNAMLGVLVVLAAVRLARVG